MKIKQLIKLLEKEDPNRIVLIASDSEGNSYHLFGGFFGLANCQKNGHEYEIWDEDDEEEERKGKPAFVLYP